jgi:predicted DNA-binding transcriptional regulator YafY
MAMQRHAGWWQNIVNFVGKFRQPHRVQQVKPRQTVAPIQPVISGPKGHDEIMMTISAAAEQLRLLRMTYKDGASRFVEPYSYRWRAGNQLFYAYCYRNSSIKSFRLDRIQDAEVTDMPYMPRWPVEIGKSS